MNSEQPYTVEFYVRADTSVANHRNAVLDRLKDLERRNHLAEFTLHLWPDAVSIDLAKESKSGILDTLRAFRAWAGQHDNSVAPSFDERPAHSTFIGEQDARIVLPTMCLAVYHDGDLVTVAPSTGKTTTSVFDVLDALEHGDLSTLAGPLQGQTVTSDHDLPDRAESANQTRSKGTVEQIVPFEEE